MQTRVAKTGKAKTSALSTQFVPKMTGLNRKRLHNYYHLPPLQIYLCMGEENYNLCCVFFQILPNLHLYSTLYLILRFTKEEVEVQKQAISEFRRYIKVNCVLLRKKRRFENLAQYPNFDVISEGNCVLPRRR